jgi:hypothetical protein
LDFVGGLSGVSVLVQFHFSQLDLHFLINPNILFRALYAKGPVQDTQTTIPIPVQMATGSLSEGSLAKAFEVTMTMTL